MPNPEREAFEMWHLEQYGVAYDGFTAHTGRWHGWDAACKWQAARRTQPAQVGEALEYVVSRENFAFTECTEAEEIWRRCKEALQALAGGEAGIPKP